MSQVPGRFDKHSSSYERNTAKRTLHVEIQWPFLLRSPHNVKTSSQVRLFLSVVETLVLLEIVNEKLILRHCPRQYVQYRTHLENSFHTYTRPFDDQYFAQMKKEIV